MSYNVFQCLIMSYNVLFCKSLKVGSSNVQGIELQIGCSNKGKHHDLENTRKHKTGSSHFFVPRSILDISLFQILLPGLWLRGYWFHVSRSAGVLGVSSGKPPPGRSRSSTQGSILRRLLEGIAWYLTVSRYNSWLSMLSPHQS